MTLVITRGAQIGRQVVRRTIFCTVTISVEPRLCGA